MDGERLVLSDKSVAEPMDIEYRKDKQTQSKNRGDEVPQCPLSLPFCSPSTDGLRYRRWLSAVHLSDWRDQPISTLGNGLDELWLARVISKNPTQFGD